MSNDKPAFVFLPQGLQHRQGFILCVYKNDHHRQVIHRKQFIRAVHFMILAKAHHAFECGCAINLVEQQESHDEFVYRRAAM